MLTCKDVATAIGQDEWREAPRWRRLVLQLHLLMCPYCRRYAAQIRAIGTVARRLLREQGEDPTALKRLRETILRHAETSPTRSDSGNVER